MTIDEDSIVRKLIEEFNNRRQKSLDKEGLLCKEIRAYELLLGIKQSDKPVDDNDCPDLLVMKVVASSLPEDALAAEYQNSLIVKAYNHFVLDGSDVNDAGKWFRKHSIMCSTLPEINEIEGLFYSTIAIVGYKYLLWLKHSNIDTNIPVIKLEYIGLLYEEFKVNFEHEKKDIWTTRFFRGSSPVSPISISRNATEGSSKLILIAILYTISEMPHDPFNFADFVKDRFGIKNFWKGITDHKEKNTFKKTYNKCRAILMK